MARFLVMLLLIAAIMVIGDTAAIKGGKCQLECNQAGNRVKLQPGHVYTYNVESTALVLLAGVDAQETRVRFEADAKVWALDKCNFAVSVNRMVLFGIDGKKFQPVDLQSQLGKPAKFALGSGNVCSNENESTWSLNVKRAVASAFVNVNDDGDATDVDIFGECPTIVSVSQNGGQVIVNRARNLNECSRRENLGQTLTGSVFNEASGVKSSPSLTGDYSSEIRLKNGVIESVNVNEEYRFVAFSTPSAGSRAKVTTKFNLKSNTKGNPSNLDSLTTVKSIAFDAPHDTSAVTAQRLRDVVRDAVDNFQDGVTANATTQFVDIVRLLRDTSKNDIKTTYQTIVSKSLHDRSDLARKIYLDALFRTSTGDSVEAIIDLIHARTLTPTEQRLALLSMNFVSGLNRESVQSFTKLTPNTPNVLPEAFLATGTLIRKYCQQFECADDILDKVMDKFTSHLHQCTPRKRKEEDIIVATLKGARNTGGRIGKKLQQGIMSCAQKDTKSRIRVAAIEALADLSCNHDVSETLIHLFVDPNLDPELRIEAYLAHSQCPTPQFADRVQKLLDVDVAQQVGAFVTSHLASLRASTDPARQNAKHVLGKVHSSKKFPFDLRRFSNSREISYAVDSLGLGASLDSSVIYSHSSFLPRSLKLNATGELFGNSFNLFDVSLRQGNLDSVLERYFGPRGILTSKSPQELYDYVKSTAQSAQSRAQSTLRGRRDVSRADVAAFSKTVQLSNDVTSSDLDLDVSVKFLGNELVFLSLGDDLPTTPDTIAKQLNSLIKEFLDGATKFKRNFEAHALFVDGELAYPTAGGLPLKLQAYATGVVGLEASGAVDLRKLWNDPSHSAIQLKLVPSGNIDVVGAMVVDVYSVTAGLQVSGSVHSSTGADVKVSILDKPGGFDVRVTMPRKKQEIFSLNHDVVFYSRERGHQGVSVPLRFSSKRAAFSGCFDQLHRYTGVTFCTDYNVTIPGNTGVAPFPLNGANQIGLWLEVDSQYHFQLTHSDRNDVLQFVRLSFDTPDATDRRTTVVALESATQPNIFVRASLESPYRRVLGEVGFVNDIKEVALYAKAVDQNSEYVAKAGFSKDEAKREYSPILQLNTPTSRENSALGYSVDGKIRVEDAPGGGTKYNLQDIRLKGGYFTTKPLAVTGSIVQKGSVFDTDLEVQHTNDKATVKGTLQFEANRVNLDMKIKGAFYANVVYKMNYQTNEVLNHLELDYGSSHQSSQHIKILQHWRHRYSKYKLEQLLVANELHLSQIPVNVRASGEFVDGAVLKYDVGLEYGNHEASSKLNVKLNEKNRGDYSVEVNASLDRKSFYLVTKRFVLENVSKYTNRLTTSAGTSIEANGVIGHKFSAQEADVVTDAKIQFAEKQTPYLLKFELKLKPQGGTSEGSLAVGKQDVLTFKGKLQRKGNNQSGDLQLTVKDILEANGEFSATGGNGTSTLNLNILKLGKTVKIASVFAIEAPTYNVATEVFYDVANSAGRRTLKVDTRNHVDSTTFRSHNDIEVFTEHYVANVEGVVDGKATDGVITANFDVVLPTSRKLSGSLRRELRPQGDGVKGTSEISLSDKLPNAQTRSLTVTSELVNGKWNQKIFHGKHNVVYRNLDGRDINVKLDVNHKAVKDNMRGVDADLNVGGSLFARSLTVALKVPQYSQNHADFSVAVRSDKDGEVQLTGRYVFGGRAKANEYDITFTGVSKGQEQHHQIQVKSSGSFLSPQVHNGVYDAKWQLTVTPNGKESTINLAGVANEDHANVKIDLKLHERHPVAVALSYNNEKSGDEETGKCQVDASVVYAKDKRIHGQGTLKRSQGREIDLHAILETPYEKANKVEFNVRTTKTNEGTIKSAVDLTVNKERYGLNSALVLSDANPSIDIVAVYPKQEVKFFAGFARVGDKKYNGKVTVVNFMDYNVDATGEVSAASIDNFSAKVDIDAPKLKLRKFHGELKNKYQGSMKGVEITASNEGKTILSGFADYTVEQNKTLTVFEAKGNVKFNDKESEAHLKFIHHTLTEAVDQETGVSFLVNAKLGSKSIVGELKLTDKNVQLKHTACEEQKECINLDVQSTIAQADLDGFRHQVIVSIDLRKLGYSHEFGLKAETTRQGVQLDHTIEMHLQAQDRPQYQYSMYLHSKRAGVIVTLPERTIALEGVFERPESFFGVWDISGHLYLDKKNKPQDNVRVGLQATTTEPKKGIANFQSALTFDHPAIRQMSVKAEGAVDTYKHSADVKLHLDVFRTAAKEILVVAKVANAETGRAFNVSSDISITSKHGLDYHMAGHAALVPEKRSASFQGSVKLANLEGSALFFVTPTNLQSNLRVLNEEVFAATGKVDNNQVTAQATLQPFKSLPIKLTATANGFTDAKFNVKRDNLLTVDGQFVINRAASVKINGVSGDIFTAQLTLDQQHFLASNYQMNNDQMRQFLKDVQQVVQDDIVKARKHIEHQFQSTKKRIGQQISNIQKDIPDFDVVGQKIRAELTRIMEELEKDPSIKPVIDVVVRFVGLVGRAFEDISQVAVQNLQKITEIVKQFYQNMMSIFEARIQPSVKEWYDAIEGILQTVYMDTMNLITGTLDRVSKALKDYEEDFNKLAKVVSETVGKFARGLTEFLGSVQKELLDMQKLMLDYLASLPGIELLKDKYNELFAQYNIPEHVISLLREFNTVIKDTVPSQEIREFVESIVVYIEAKLEKKEVNDLEYLKQIYVKSVTVTKALIQIVKSQPTDVSSSLNVTPGGVPLPLSLDILRRVPYISSVRLSPLNYLRNERFLTPRDILTSVTLNGRLSFNVFPPFPLVGHVVDGEHVFTFDGRHFTFPGDCSYILTRDFLHGNFSVVANLLKGRMASLSVFEGSNVVVVEVGGSVKVNDKVADLPVHQEDLHIWRRYYTVNVLSRSGVEVMCTTDLVICHVTVSGFYRGRLRGILGNGNGEPQDDFQMPSGAISTNYAEFGMTYGLGTCPAIPSTHAHHAHDAQLAEPCASLFVGDPTLRLAFLVIDPHNYREACQHAVTTSGANKLKVACNIIRAYVSAARMDGIPVSVPDKCLTCSENRKIGQQFTTKAPTKQADVVFVVDTSVPQLLNDFTHQLTQELRRELKAFDMADVNVAVIGFERHQRYPSHFTHGGKLDIHGKIGLKSDSAAPKCNLHLKTGFEQVDEVIEQWANVTEDLMEDLGLSADARAFQEAMSYPFRAKATKIIFAVRSDPLLHSKNPSKTLTATLANSQVKKRGIQLHLLSPVADFTISGKDIRGAVAKDIVGFSSRTVIQASDAKKRANPGQTAWRKSIKYTEDLGIELVQDADGFVFLLQNYQGAPVKARKQFVGAVATAVADHAARFETHLECECEVMYGLHPEEQCTVTEVKMLKHVQRMHKG